MKTVRKKKRKVFRPGGGALLTIGELSSNTGESVKTLRRWSSAGIIPHIPISYRCKRFQLDRVLAALSKLEAGGKRRFVYEQPNGMKRA